ncbi:hypothetical protein F4777DRAFT_601370 [Nemania sp. FL0916]|nr:hypothetical protein F4777DRAFT_601370 [Nemania sp. FL0916]
MVYMKHQAMLLLAGLTCDRTIADTGKTYKDKLQQAFADVGTLAVEVQNGKDENDHAFTENILPLLWSWRQGNCHTYDTTIYDDRVGVGGDGKHDQADVCRSSNSSSCGSTSLDGYTITVNCGSDQDSTCDKSTLASTNAQPGATVITFCDRFFSANTVETRQDLTSKTIGSKRGQWYQEREKFGFFEVAALTVFHEMTHLDIVGQKAGLSSRPDPQGYNSAGTVDVYVQGSNDDKNHYANLEPWQAARTLHGLWNLYNDDMRNYKPLTPTTENAES